MYATNIESSKKSFTGGGSDISYIMNISRGTNERLTGSRWYAGGYLEGLSFKNEFASLGLVGGCVFTR